MTDLAKAVQLGMAEAMIRHGYTDAAAKLLKDRSVDGVSSRITKEMRNDIAELEKLAARLFAAGRSGEVLEALRKMVATLDDVTDSDNRKTVSLTEVEEARQEMLKHLQDAHRKTPEEWGAMHGQDGQDDGKDPYTDYVNRLRSGQP